MCLKMKPKLASGLSKLSQVILTPHTASATIEAREAMAVIAAKNILAGLAGRSLPNLLRIDGAKNVNSTIRKASSRKKEGQKITEFSI